MHALPSLLPRELILLVTSVDRRYGSILHNLGIFGLIFQGSQHIHGYHLGADLLRLARETGTLGACAQSGGK